MALSPGTRLGPYEIVGVLGTGGMGEVYRARDPRLDRDVAVKVLPLAFASDPLRLRRFEREARAAASLNHPGIVTVFDVGLEGGVPYVVTELLEGLTLREVQLLRRPTQQQVLSWAVQVARGLDAAHCRGLVHRDVKPSNVFVTTDGRAKVLDFGIASTSSGAGGQDTTASETAPTSPGSVPGTLAYMSPEQARAVELDGRSDLFSFGVVLYELLSGRHPFARETSSATVAAIVGETPPGLATLQRSVSPALSSVVARCLEKDPDERFRSAHDLALALEALAHGPALRSLAEVEEHSPYPGLSSFTERDAAVFFGREQEAQAFWQQLSLRRLLGVIGSSGAGKTSFVRAGVVASRPAGWGAVFCTPGTSPLRGLGRALAPELLHDSGALLLLVSVDDETTAFELVRRWRRAHDEALLVVDQLEELFTLNAADVQQRFARLLGRLVREADVHVVLSLRDDFLLRCCEHDELSPVLSGLTALLPLRGADLRRALAEPARRRGYAFEDDSLLEELLASVAGERAALPLLAFAVSRLWERRDRRRKLLTRAAYEEIGGVAGALAQHAEATLERIGSERLPLVREIFRNLATSQGTRAVAERDELLSAFPQREAAERVLRELVDARLLTEYETAAGEPRAGHGSVEVAHESLLTAWPRLAQWRAQDQDGAILRDQLKQAARLWQDRGRPPDLLWSGTSFREYELWRTRYPGALTALEEEFARAMARRVQRRRTLQRAAVAAAIVALAGIAIAIGVSREQATRARDAARTEAVRAEAAGLVALAQLRLVEDPTEALAFATSALELADSREARLLAVRVLAEGPPAIDLPTGVTDGRSPSFSPDGSRLALGGHSESVLVWSDDGRAPLSLGGHDTSSRGTNLATWASDGLLVTGLCCGLSERVHLWALPAGRRVRTIELGGASAWDVAKGRLVARRPGHDARAWDLGDGASPSAGPPPPQPRWRAEVRPKERQLLVWDRSTLPAARPLALRRGGSWYIAGFALHPRGEWAVATTHTNTRVSFWPLGRAAPVVVDGYRGDRRPLAFSPDGRWLATAWTTDDRARGRVLQLVPLPGNESPARSLAVPEAQPWCSLRFDPRGRFLLASGNAGRAAIVPLDGAPVRELRGFAADAFLESSAVSPSGRYVAAAFGFGTAEKALRVWDAATGVARRFPLPEDGSPTPGVRSGYEGLIASVAFADDTTLYTAGWGGVRRFDLETGRHEIVLASPGGSWSSMAMSPDRRSALVAFCRPGNQAAFSVRLWRQQAGDAEIPALAGDAPIHYGALAVDATATLGAAGDMDGLIRVFRLPDGVPHLLAGHRGAVGRLSFSPDGRWLASTGDDDTLRLWPVPDLSRPPLHSLPRAELVARLRSLTNLRAVRDPSTPSGWRIEVGAFPGWRRAPAW